MRAKRRRRSLWVVAACLLAAYGAIVQRDFSRAPAHRLALPMGVSSKPIPESETLPSSISNTGLQGQKIFEDDRNFLNELVQKEKQGDDPAIGSSGARVLRGELVVNSEVVRRGELVARDGRVKRRLLGP